MSYNLKFYEKYLEKLKKFSEVDWVKNHIELKKKPNFWTIIEYGKDDSFGRRSSHEIRYSKMLAWLLDANGNHNLGNVFAYKLIKRIDDNSSYKESSDKNDLIEADTEALNSNIDIFYQDLEQDVCMAIELKQYTTEHGSQLDKYVRAVGEFVKQKDRHILAYYVYLTPTKEEPSNDNWVAMGYCDIIKVLEEIDKDYLVDSDYIYKNDVRKLIGDFKDDLQRTVDKIEKDVSYIEKIFSKEELNFTETLTKEIRGSSKRKHMENILNLSGQDSDIETLVLMVNRYSNTQDHTPNDGVQLLMRKIFNYLSGEQTLSLDLNVKYKLKERKSKIKMDIVNKYDLDFNTIQLTQDKGQGLYFNHNKREDKQLYISGDALGNVPNDGMQLLNVTGTGKKVIERKSQNIRTSMFYTNHDLAESDEIALGKDVIMSIEDFVNTYLLKEVKFFTDMLKK